MYTSGRIRQNGLRDGHARKADTGSSKITRTEGPALEDVRILLRWAEDRPVLKLDATLGRQRWSEKLSATG